MIKTISYLFLVLSLAFNLGCANRAIVSDWPETSFVKSSTWMKLAAKHEQKGDLQKALYEYRIAKTVAGGSRKIDKQIRRVEKLIDQKVNTLYSTAEKARNRGQRNTAKKLYLEILALDPHHQKSFTQLRRLNKEKLQHKMQSKVALSQRYYQKKSRKKKSKKNYEDEGYVYSRQAILQAENRAMDVATYIRELEKHILKYPNDTELSDMLMRIRIVQAEAAFNSARYEESLNHLYKAEEIFNSDRSAITKLTSLRKKLGKKLYLQGVRSARNEPEKAVDLWKTALKFDPKDRKSQLRIKKYEKR